MILPSGDYWNPKNDSYFPLEVILNAIPFKKSPFIRFYDSQIGQTRHCNLLWIKLYSQEWCVQSITSFSHCVFIRWIHSYFVILISPCENHKQKIGKLNTRYHYYIFVTVFRIGWVKPHHYYAPIWFLCERELISCGEWSFLWRLFIGFLLLFPKSIKHSLSLTSLTMVLYATVGLVCLSMVLHQDRVPIECCYWKNELNRERLGHAWMQQVN